MFPALSPTVFLKIEELSACQATCAASYLGEEGILDVSLCQLSSLSLWSEQQTACLKFTCAFCLYA